MKRREFITPLGDRLQRGRSRGLTSRAASRRSALNDTIILSTPWYRASSCPRLSSEPSIARPSSIRHGL